MKTVRVKSLLGRAGLAAGVSALLWCVAVPAVHAQMPPPAPTNVVALSASAFAEVSQDWLTVSLSTSRDGADANAVQTQLKQALDQALAEARKVAQPGQLEVRTGAFALYPRYAPVTRASNGAVTPGGLAGWQGKADLLVQGRDTAAISQLVGRIKTMTVQSVGFSLSRQARDQLEAEVTVRAIARFQERAAAVAKAFGMPRWTLREVSLSGAEPSPPIMENLMRSRSSAVAMADAPLPVEAGEATVSITVSGTVQLQP